MVAVRVEAGGEVALEVGDAIGIIAREDEDVGVGEDGGGEGRVVGEGAEEREQRLVARRLVAVHAALQPDADFVACGVGVRAGREVDVGE